MPRPRSYRQPTPSITVDYSASTLSRWGFFPVILEYLRNRQLPQRLGSITIKTAANGLYSTRDKLMSLVTISVVPRTGRDLKGLRQTDARLFRRMTFGNKVITGGGHAPEESYPQPSAGPSRRR